VTRDPNTGTEVAIALRMEESHVSARPLARAKFQDRPLRRKDDAGPSGPALAFLLTGEKPLEFRTTKGRNSPAAPQGGPGYESCRA
jgi:hypothetical protein